MVARWIAFAVGLGVVMSTLMTVAGTLVVPRAVNSPISRLIVWFLDVAFLFVAKRVRSFGRRDRILAWQAPLSLLIRLAVWLGLLVVGFALLLQPSLKGHLGQAFSEAGSSIFTLGYAAPASGDSTTLEYLAAFAGLVVIGLQVGYLPTCSSEILIGRNIAKKFRIAGLGGTINFGGRTWIVAGIMDSAGTAFDSEIWGDVDTVMGAFKRAAYSSVIIRMKNPSGLSELKEAVIKDPRLVEEARREDEYYEAQSELMARFIRILGISLTLIFSLGAITGSMITMYAAVAARTSEIGTLRALGFRRLFILFAFLAEAVFLSLLGAVIGLVAASFMNRLTISTMNWTTFSELTFRFLLNRGIIVSSVIFAVVMGITGGALPSIRAARMNIVAALRAR